MNLVFVDQWANDFLSAARDRAWSNFADFFQTAFSALETKARTEKAGIARLELVDDEGIQWIFDPPTRRIFWRQEVALNIGDQTFWLRIKADQHTALNQIAAFQHEQWQNQDELKKHLTMLEEASLLSHRTGAELRLK